MPAKFANYTQLPKISFLVISSFWQHWLVQRLNRRLNPCLQFSLVVIPFFTGQTPISHAASGTGSSATGIPSAAYIQCRTWLIDALQKCGSFQAGYAIIWNISKYEPICPCKAWNEPILNYSHIIESFPEGKRVFFDVQMLNISAAESWSGSFSSKPEPLICSFWFILLVKQSLVKSNVCWCHIGQPRVLNLL